MINRVCVYCASSTQVDPAYFEAARQLGGVLADSNVTTVYGGGAKGLMGTLADAALENSGEVEGIIPRFMCEVEWNHTGLSRLVLVDTMHERKARMAKDVDAVVALPGGCGTFEELLEVITWKRLGLFTKPIIILNVKGYFDPLVEMLNRAVDENFMREEHRQIWQVVDDPLQVIETIATAPRWSENARQFASL